ncbi:hypothetical protein FN846DRAFT_205760 [Sphaerosporella brunnea]|uniref:Uncharacterized protein n=1 Tax=Sphaerosporella brunnea TaxID=1250544 RepID=A0A5J5EPF3_9PEZI|nr:hypothetical protein FN846DRAFT_205760 [Sphaerosporella brunnea]
MIPDGKSRASFADALRYPLPDWALWRRAVGYSASYPASPLASEWARRTHTPNQLPVPEADTGDWFVLLAPNLRNPAVTANNGPALWIPAGWKHVVSTVNDSYLAGFTFAPKAHIAMLVRAALGECKAAAELWSLFDREKILIFYAIQNAPFYGTTTLKRIVLKNSKRAAKQERPQRARTIIFTRDDCTPAPSAAEYGYQMIRAINDTLARHSPTPSHRQCRSASSGNSLWPRHEEWTLASRPSTRMRSGRRSPSKSGGLRTDARMDAGSISYLRD